MKKILLGTAALALTAGVAMAQDTVRMGTEGAYPPYNFIDDNGDVAGFEIVLGNELCARAELTCEWVTNDWDSIIPNLVSSNYDTIMAGMSITDERDEVIDFTQDYYPPTESAYVAMSEEADFESGVVAAQASTIQAAHVAEGDAALIEFATPEETVSAMRSGEADAVFADYDYLKPIVDASGGELMFVGDPVPLGGGIGMGLRESDTELKEKFDAAITSMKEDGSLNELLVEWFGEEIGQY
ncbi:transporter substrate-binding domain-containing protein [Allosediminivita pacifica]|uniref:Amino acid ABC transporter substrate-binding protein (PAAT family) n=1 Tax=Allosediminivita pacifica TaxID=1267769 RepID=A0A2T6B0Y3_9RHOB|nr:transporter substrate-binding domain-containing protein [Allosediminivita pacifica]PTX49738.1 amino acid ABC transporter substrate-binding protein (PAAT family) [Allosediminivita pacifica]GGB04218.1 amino acid ABC transporter [Allosediminivita pacifica]